AVRIGHADIAFGMKPLGLLVVDHLVGFDARSIVEHLDVADRRDARIVVIVVDLDRLDQHLSIIGGARRFRARRLRIVGEALGRYRRRRRHVHRDGKRQAEHQAEQGAAARGQTPSTTAHERAPLQRKQPSLAGGDYCHYPSSWYSKAKKPVRPPTSTGSHAAAIGCINSALLKSSVTFDST